MAHCPACGKTVPVLRALQFPSGGTYRCPCGAQTVVDPDRFRLASGACAYLTLLVPAAAYLCTNRAVTTVLAFLLWCLVSPVAFASWTTLRLTPRRGRPDLPPR